MGFLALVLGACSAASVDAQVTQIAFVPGDNNGRVQSVQVPTMVPGALEIVGQNPRAVAVSPDGRRLFVANYGGATGVTVFETISFNWVTTIPDAWSAHGLAISPDGRWLYVTRQSGATVLVVDLNDYTIAATIPVGSGPAAISLNPAGTYAYVSNESGETVSVIDTSTRTVVSTIPIGGAGTSLAISPDGTKGYVTLGYGTVSQRVRVLNLVTNTAGLMIDFTGVAVGSAVFSKDGSYVFMGGINTGLIYVIDTLTDTVVDTEPAPPGGPSGISVSADGSRFYVITNNSWLAQYDAFTYEQIGSAVALGTVAARTIGSFLSPPMLTSGTLPITTDADLDTPGFGTYVNFSGGALRINGNWSTSRVISVLPGGGTIDTNGWPLTVPSTINDGVLTKSGTGLLTITTPGHTGGTTITAGGLLVGGGTTHSAPITVQGGALHGSGTAGSITVSGGAIQPGTPGAGNTAILQATEVTFSPGGSFVVDITGATAGSGYDQLAVSGVSTLGAGVATLTVNLLYAPISGTSFTILTNATGHFQGLPEGGTFLLGAENFRITYQGGDGNDVVLTADDVPSASAIGPQTIVESRVLGPLSLTIGDDLTPAGSLVVTGSSSNTAVVEDNDIVVSGSGTSRDITVTPVALANGQTTITLNVSDGFNTIPVTFLLTVTPDNDPTITGPANESMTRDTVLGPLAFTIGDDLTAVASLTVTASSSNTAVVRNQDLTLGGSGAARTLTVTPVTHASGSTTITLSVFDGLQTTTHPIALTVTMDGPPTIIGPGNHQYYVGDPIAPIPVMIDDDLIAPAALTLTATSSNLALVRNEDLVLGGSARDRTLTIAPLPEAFGTATITVSVSDGVHTTPHVFTLTIKRDEPPTVTGIGNRTTWRDTVLGPLAFAVFDDRLMLPQMTISAISSNQAVVRDQDIAVSGLDGMSGPPTLTITPVAGALGTTTITLSVADARSTTTHAFVVEVVEPVRRYYLTEGATGSFFDTDLLLANPQDVAVPVSIEFLGPEGSVVTVARELLPTSRTTIRLDEIAGLEAAEVSTIVSSTTGLPIVVERTMRWDASGYGSHTEKATEDGPGLSWYFAEGSQNAFFKTYLLLANPGDEANVAYVTYIREGEPSLTVEYPLAPASRYTIDAGTEPGLVGRAFGAIVFFDRPGLAERAMYFGGSPLFTGGHVSVGAVSPATTWFLAEGATGSYFSTYVLLANPGTEAAQATVTFLPDTGVPVTKVYTVRGQQRLTLDIAQEDPALAAGAVGARVESDRPIVVERSQYWPNGAWHEAHNSGGVTAPGQHWGLAEGRVGGATSDQTFILFANPGTETAIATVRFLRTDGTTVMKTVTVAATSRVTVSVGGVGSDVPELIDESFGAAVDSTQPIVVERSMYSTVNGVPWAAGTNATATRLP